MGIEDLNLGNWNQSQRTDRELQQRRRTQRETMIIDMDTGYISKAANADKNLKKKSVTSSTNCSK